MELIKQYLEDKISKEFFFEQLYLNKDLQERLDQENGIPPYTNDGSLLLYLISGNPKKHTFIVDSKDAMKKYLEKNDVKFNFSNASNEISNIILDVLPKWLDAPYDYFESITKQYQSTNKKEIKDILRKKIETDFISLKNKPKWIQAPNWPIENGIPLIFIGENDMSDINHDTTKVYVFFNKIKDIFICIKQSQ